MGEIEDDLLRGAYDRPELAVSDIDLWLDRRLSEQADATWLKNRSLYPTVTFIHHLGRQLCVSRFTTAVDELTLTRDADLLVFQIVSQGQAAIENVLDELAFKASGHLGEPNKAYGRLFFMLSHQYEDDPEFATFQELLHASILRNYAVKKGCKVVGKVLAHRRLHSVTSASDEAGVGQKLLIKLLVEAGAIVENDSRPAARITFAADQYDYVLKISPAGLPG